MSIELIVATFESESEAGQVLKQLEKLTEDEVLDLGGS